MTSYTNEHSSLLPTAISSNMNMNMNMNNNSNENEDEDDMFPSQNSGADGEDGMFLALDKRRDSFSQMIKVVHNDKSLKQQYESAEDFDTLLGSTKLLKGAIDQDIAVRRSSRSNSFTMVLEPTREIDFENMSAISFRPNGYNNGINSIGKRSASMSNVRSGSSSRSSGGSRRESLDRSNHKIQWNLEKIYKTKISRPSTLYLKKIKTSFFDDAKSLAEGTIPQSIVLATVIGIVCGVACYVYYSILFYCLDFIWNVIPEEYIIPSEHWSPEYYWLWIPLVCSSMSTLVGLTVVYMGEPGDLPYTISRVHCEAYIPMNHVFPMVFASMFSILGESFSAINMGLCYYALL